MWVAFLIQRVPAVKTPEGGEITAGELMYVFISYTIYFASDLYLRREQTNVQDVSVFWTNLWMNERRICRKIWLSPKRNLKKIYKKYFLMLLAETLYNDKSITNIGQLRFSPFTLIKANLKSIIDRVIKTCSCQTAETFRITKPYCFYSRKT